MLYFIDSLTSGTVRWINSRRALRASRRSDGRFFRRPPSMSILDALSAELTHEATGTLKMLESIPGDQLAYKPHEKSMTLGRLGDHIAEIPGWSGAILGMDVLDLATFPPPAEPTSTAQVVEKFNASMTTWKQITDATSDAELGKEWKMVMGDTELITMPKGQVLRVWVLNHLIHHRGQLSVYLRQLDVALPPIYGPTADHEGF
nr:uncharacterized protein YrdA-like [Nerophis lumbriciformis]